MVLLQRKLTICFLVVKCTVVQIKTLSTGISHILLITVSLNCSVLLYSVMWKAVLSLEISSDKGDL